MPLGGFISFRVPSDPTAVFIRRTVADFIRLFTNPLISTIMYITKYLKWRVLIARSLKKLYYQPNNADWTLGKIHDRFGEALLGVNRETFVKYCTKYEEPDEKLPLHIAAVLPLLEPFRKMANELETGAVRPSDVTDPIYKPLVDLYRKRAFLERVQERQRREELKKKASGK